MSYSLALLSPIPVVKRGATAETLDLWARDLEVQVNHVSRLKLICPILQTPPTDWSGTAPLRAEIELVPIGALKGSGLSSAIAGCDLVQVPGGQRWSEANVSRRLVTRARQAGIKSIVGISSNRGRTAMLNAGSASFLQLAKALWNLGSIRLAQYQLTGSADGTFVVGAGLRKLVSRRCGRLHVGIASWVKQEDLDAAPKSANRQPGSPLIRMCIAARLERMKGIHVGIDALANLVRRNGRGAYALTVLGDGPEREQLQRQVERADLTSLVIFGGTRSYPTAFFAELRKHDLMLLTNLNDEQPRLIFDAICQGCIPICPDAPAYRTLGLPPEVLYSRGDCDSLVQTIERLTDKKDLSALWSNILATAGRFTLDTMHAKRAGWVQTEVLGRRAGDQPMA